MGLTANEAAFIGGISAMNINPFNNRTFTKTIYNKSAKLKQQIEASLEMEIQFLERTNAGFRYKKSTYRAMPGDQLEFIIEFERV